MNTFALIGVAGYVAPKHLDTIKFIGGKLVATVDPNDNVELLDEFFPESEYFKNLAQFEQYLASNNVDFVCICSPTHLHFEHIQLALKNNCNAICESPMVLSVNELNEIKKLEQQTGKKVYNLLQLRYHPAMKQLKESAADNEESEIELKYHTYRGKWFNKSWKGDKSKSGGVLTSLGYHFFDLLIEVFGKPVNFSVSELTEHTATGLLQLEKAKITFDLRNHVLPDAEIKRELKVCNTKIDLQQTGKDEFRKCYLDILKNKGFTTSIITPVIELLNH
ncbi:MAG: Gfo/Idh/MocA family oxidoreductase [Prolixibacteraceae bacterium]|jgi:UDP-N-acetyl-2-amino-2-deoxyglucuronate dehydrogenase|nr:Gfo/Idh/MocA family oxidoreductase [Prolixibacteraceae bacterium]